MPKRGRVRRKSVPSQARPRRLGLRLVTLAVICVLLLGGVVWLTGHASGNRTVAGIATPFATRTPLPTTTSLPTPYLGMPTVGGVVPTGTPMPAQTPLPLAEAEALALPASTGKSLAVHAAGQKTVLLFYAAYT